MPTATDNYVEVHVIVRGANEQDSDVTVKRFIRAGDHIPTRLNEISAIAANLAYYKLTPRAQKYVDDSTGAS